MEEWGNILDSGAIVKFIDDDNLVLGIASDEQFHDMRTDETGASSEQNGLWNEDGGCFGCIRGGDVVGGHDEQGWPLRELGGAPRDGRKG